MLNKIQRKLVLSLVMAGFLLTFNVTLAAELTNPLGTNDPRVVIGNLIRAILGIVGSLALAVFIYGGFNWVISAGNEDKIKKGKDMITWATFGLAVIFASYALVSFIIGSITGGASDTIDGPSADTIDGPPASVPLNGPG